MEIEMSKVRFGDQFVYSFASDHNLFITGQKHDKFEVKSATSQFINKLMPYPKDMGIPEYQIAYRGNPRYGNIFHDPYRKCFYRFAYEGADLNLNNKDAYFNPPQFSIIIFDEHLIKIGEVMMEKNKYLFDNNFVGPEGLYLSKSHPLSYEFDEDILSFDIFVPEEI